MKQKQITIIGAGTMGCGIAQVFIQNDFKTFLIDKDKNVLEICKNKLSKRFDKLIEEGKIANPEKFKFLNNLTLTTDLDLVKNSFLIIEAVFEDIRLKRNLISNIENILNDENVIIASNTSSLSINNIASLYKKPENIIGIHFFNPAPVIQLVEVIVGIKTSEKVLRDVVDIIKKIGKEPVIVKDSPGFIVNRLIITMINEAILLLSENAVKKEDIDKAIRLGANHKMGPLELADLIGLDVCLNIMESFYKSFKEKKYRPAPLLKKMVTLGKLGRKSGIGFYNYKVVS